MSGRFIVLEGIDGSGKGTQLDLLKVRLEHAGHTVWVTREPSESKIGKLIREGLGDATKMDEATIALLFAADRLHHIHDIKTHLAQGDVVLCDRYVLSSLAYNSQALTLEWILDINKHADSRLHPDLTLLFDLSARDAMHRIDVRGDAKERYENQKQLLQIRDMYLMLAEVRHDDNVTVINAAQAPNDVHEATWKALEAIL